MLNFVKNPGAGKRPIVFCGGRRNIQHLRRFFVRHPREITKFYDLGLDRMFQGKAIQHLMHGEQLLVCFRSGQILAFEINPFKSFAMSCRKFTAGAINQDTTHRLGGGGKKMSAIFKMGIFSPHQTQPCLMHQFSGLECLARCLPGHLAVRQPAQFPINQFQQFAGGLGVALSDSSQQYRSVAHLVA